MNRWGDKMVPGEGPAHAKIMIVGEAPGVDEERAGRPFVGGAGKCLDMMLADSGINRADCYITNLVKYRPTGNEFSQFYHQPCPANPLKREPEQVLLAGTLDVLDDIRRTRPNVVILLGAEPLYAITGRVGITKHRGSVYFQNMTEDESYGVKIVATYHPAAVLREWKLRPVCLMDLEKALGESTRPELTRLERHLYTDPTYDQVMTYLTNIETNCMKVSFDIETETDQITCIGLSTAPDHAMCIPFWYGSSGNLWSRDQEASIWLKLKSVLENVQVPKIAQNAQFDMWMLADLMGLRYGVCGWTP